MGLSELAAALRLLGHWSACGKWCVTVFNTPHTLHLVNYLHQPTTLFTFACLILSWSVSERAVVWGWLLLLSYSEMHCDMDSSKKKKNNKKTSPSPSQYFRFFSVAQVNLMMGMWMYLGTVVGVTMPSVVAFQSLYW